MAPSQERIPASPGSGKDRRADGGQVLLAGPPGHPGAGNAAQGLVNVGVPDLFQRIAIDAAGTACGAEALAHASCDHDLPKGVSSAKGRRDDDQ